MSKGMISQLNEGKKPVAAQLVCSVVGLAPFWLCAIAFLMPRLALYGDAAHVDALGATALPTVMALAFAACCALATRFCDLLRTSGRRIVLVAMTFLAMLGLCVLGAAGGGIAEDATWAPYLIWAAVGFGLACLLMLWSSLLSRFDKAFFSTVLCASFALAGICALGMHFVVADARPWTLALALALSVGVLMMLWVDMGTASNLTSRAESLERHTLDIPVDILNTIYNAALCAILVVLQASPLGEGCLIGTLLLAGSIAIGGIVSLVYLDRHPMQMVHGPIQKILFPVLMFVLLPLPIAHGVLALACFAVSLAAFSIYWIVVLDSLVALVRHYNVSPFYLVPRGMVPTMLGIAIGSLLGWVTVMLSAESELATTWMTILLALVLVVCFTFLPLDEDHLKPVEIPDEIATADVVLGNPSNLFQQHCEAMAKANGLSARESQVFFLLAQGHTTAYIQSRLYISQHTVKSHRYSIYKKLNISSRDELITLVDENMGAVSDGASSGEEDADVKAAHAGGEGC